VSVAAKYNDLEPQAGLLAFLEEVALLENTAGEEDSNSEAVTLMTMHAAKGLEFQHVFVVGMEEGLFPHSRVFTDPRELEEERRLAYVAITRAKIQLYLVHADSRLYFGSRQQNLVSRFIEDIPQELISRLAGSSYRGKASGWDDLADDWGEQPPRVEVQSGDKVKHAYFGVGTVLSADDSIIRINFGGVYGVKELARDLAPLTRV
jgi:DNA helicase-2/ATP-dependent DNA helicase PcrA